MQNNQKADPKEEAKKELNRSATSPKKLSSQVRARPQSSSVYRKKLSV